MSLWFGRGEICESVMLVVPTPLVLIRHGWDISDLPTIVREERTMVVVTCVGFGLLIATALGQIAWGI